MRKSVCITLAIGAVLCVESAAWKFPRLGFFGGRPRSPSRGPLIISKPPKVHLPPGSSGGGIPHRPRPEIIVNAQRPSFWDSTMGKVTGGILGAAAQGGVMTGAYVAASKILEKPEVSTEHSSTDTTLKVTQPELIMGPVGLPVMATNATTTTPAAPNVTAPPTSPTTPKASTVVSFLTPDMKDVLVMAGLSVFAVVVVLSCCVKAVVCMRKRRQEANAFVME